MLYALWFSVKSDLPRFCQCSYIKRGILRDDKRKKMIEK